MVLILKIDRVGLNSIGRSVISSIGNNVTSNFPFCDLSHYSQIYREQACFDCYYFSESC